MAVRRVMYLIILNNSVHVSYSIQGDCGRIPVAVELLGRRRGQSSSLTEVGAISTHRSVRRRPAPNLHPTRRAALGQMARFWFCMAFRLHLLALIRACVGNAADGCVDPARHAQNIGACAFWDSSDLNTIVRTGASRGSVSRAAAPR